MDMEKLNKSQIVLLTLLVSFMTSIATGIVTVALMEQAPPAITETVNRVVERTVERVVPGQTASAAAAAPEVKTVLVHDADLIPQAVAAASPAIVRVYTSGSSTNATFLGLGVVLNSSGLVAADSGALGQISDVTVELSGGKRIRSFVQSRDAETGVAYIAGATSTAEGPVVWAPAKISTGNPSLGQRVILISGKSAARVGQGLITSMAPLSSEKVDATQVLETDLSKDGILSGSPIIDTQGQVLGISTSVSREVDDSGFIPGTVLHPAVPAKESKEKAGAQS